jgi:adenosylcobinamide kinase/adenosylcobinamide-phosphate guanylyltransferase
MDDRIARHQADRNPRVWCTIEEELALDKRIIELTPQSVCLIDCLTLWVNNLLYDAEKSDTPFGEDEMAGKVTSFINACEQFDGTVICVSNEVGMGVVPDNQLARKYRDLVGRSNRLIAAAAGEVILVSCGLPLILKDQSTK